jgi:hypothetical protein
MRRLVALGLVRGDEALPRTLAQACHKERLVGGLSLSLRATPDEVIGWLAHAMGGRARKLKVLDVRGATLEVECGELHEHWRVDSLEALIDRLNETFCDDDGLKLLVVLGEHEDMLQAWALSPEVLEVLLETTLLDEARNRRTLRELLDLDG